MNADQQRIVVDCPVCRRTVWAGSVCLHGAVPPPKKGTTDGKPKPPTGGNSGKVPKV
jgi:hypothetical protein